ncbi:hypothetical protein GE061_012523 [Apolygus lucorum]|uniref:BRCT domain-containing protein n=1 Tax=Apolygus lucorum TaxID=248454 RepID=A0A8S9XWM1_APOLU|nr:hypothetical protein GE061_012523 [Apolygus lucorum]
MDNSKDIFFCCECRNVLPDYVIFPCGHFLCNSCENVTNCSICDQPICLIKDSLSLRCYRTLVSAGLYNPEIDSSSKPKTPVVQKAKTNSRKRLFTSTKRRKRLENGFSKATESSVAQKARSTNSRKRLSTSDSEVLLPENGLSTKDEATVIVKANVSHKRKKKNSESAEDEITVTPRPVRCSLRNPCKKVINSNQSTGQRGVRTRSSGSTDQAIESNPPGPSTVNETPKKGQTTKQSVVPVKAQSLKNSLSASKPRLDIAEKVKSSLDDIVNNGTSPPLKKRKPFNPRPSLSRLSLRTTKRHIDSSDDDEGVFIDSDSIVGCGKTVKVVAQVHADPCFSSAASVENSQVGDEMTTYTQVGLGHLDRDEERDDGDDSSKTPVKSTGARALMSGKYHLSSPFINTSPGEFTGFKVDKTAATEMVDSTVESVAKSATPVVESKRTLRSKTPKIKKFEISEPGEVQRLIHQDSSQLPTGSITEADTVCHTETAEKPQSIDYVISDSIYNKNTDAKEDEMELSSSCMEDKTDGFTVDTPRHLLDDSAPFVEKLSPKYSDVPIITSNLVSFESNHPQSEVRLESDMVQEQEMDDSSVIPSIRASKCFEDSSTSQSLQNGGTSESILPQANVVDPLFDDGSNFNKAAPEKSTCDQSEKLDGFLSVESNISLKGSSLQVNETDVTLQSSFPDSSAKCLHFVQDEPAKPPTGISSESLPPLLDVRSSEGNQTSTDLPESAEPSSLTTTNVVSSDSLNPQAVITTNSSDLPDIHGSDIIGASVEIPKHPYLIFDEDSEPACFSFADKRLRVKISTDSEKPPTEVLQPKSIGSGNVLQEQASEILPNRSSREGPPNFSVKTQRPIKSPSNEVPDSLSFAGKISNGNRNQDNIDIANVPAFAVPVTVPSSTSGKTHSDVQPSDSNCNLISDNIPSQTSAIDLSQLRWHEAQKFLTDAFCKLYRSERPKSLFRLAFDVLTTPLKTEDIFHGLSAVSPITASVEKSVQVDLFLDQTTVKVEVGKDLVKRNSFTRRQLSFVPEEKSGAIDDQSDPEESEDIVEGTPTKPQLVRVNLMNESSTLCSPLSRTSTHEESPAQPRVQSVATEDVFSIFDPAPQAMDIESEERNLNESVCHNHARPPSPDKFLNRKPAGLTSPRKPVALVNKGTTPQTENIDPSRPPSLTPISQLDDSSIACADSESIIGGSEQLPQRRKLLLDLPIGRSNESPKEGAGVKANNPVPFRGLSNVFQIATSGIYDAVEKTKIQKLCTLIKATLSPNVTKDTTHLIVPDGEITVTTKFLMAVYNGSFILPMRWVFDCLISRKIVPEARYFFRHPGIYRRSLMPKNSSLFDNYAFFITPEIKKDPVNYNALKDLMIFCNCNIFDSAKGIIDASTKFKAVVLRGADYMPPKVIEGPNGIVQVNYQWFFSCLKDYDIQPFDMYD